MDLKIRDKVALIGASAGGLGLACAQRLAEEGCRVFLCDKDQEKVTASANSLSVRFGADRVGHFLTDLTNAAEIDRLIERVKDQLGPIDILITNSGGPPPGTFDVASDDKWLFAYDLTFMSAVRLIRGVLPDMKKKGWGRIINLCSRTLREPIANLIVSNAVRLAVAGMAKTLSSEIALNGITVNNVGPGPTSTDRAIELAKARADKKGIDVEQELKATNQRIPRGRMAIPDEIAATVTFLASDLAGHITGQSILVDGGETKAL